MCISFRYKAMIVDDVSFPIPFLGCSSEASLSSLSLLFSVWLLNPR